MPKRRPMPAPMARNPPGPGGQRKGCKVPLPDAAGKFLEPGLPPVAESIDMRFTETDVDCHAPPNITCGPCNSPRPAGFQYTEASSALVGPAKPVSATWAVSYTHFTLPTHRE